MARCCLSWVKRGFSALPASKSVCLGGREAPVLVGLRQSIRYCPPLPENAPRGKRFGVSRVAYRGDSAFDWTQLAGSGGHESTRGAHCVCLSLIHISEPTRLRRISYAVFCLKKKNKK